MSTGEAADAILWIMLTATSDEVRERAGAALRDLAGEVSFSDAVQGVARMFWSANSADRHDGAVAFLLLWTSPAQDALAAMTFPEPDQQDDELARDPDPQISATAAVMAGLAGRPPVELLAAHADEQDALVREAAVAALGRLAAGDGIELVARLAVQDTEPRVRIAALRALGQRAPAGAAGLVAPALESDQAAERETAATVLGALGEQAALAPVLRRLRAEEVPSVRWALLEAAIALNDQDTAPPELAQAIRADLAGDTVARALGAAAAGRAGLTETSAQLRELMRSDRSDDVRDEAAEAYGRVAPPDALLRLVEELAAGEPPGEHLTALGYALRHRSRDVVDGLVARISGAGATPSSPGARSS